jgi:integrase
MAKANALSAVFVKQCRKAGVYRDGQGLILRVEATGTKRWVLRVKIRGKSRDIGLGSAKDVSLVEARDRAHELRRLVRDGTDPVGAQRAARTTIPTFAEAAELVHRQRLKGWSNGKHRNQWLSTLRDHAFPVIGATAVSEISTADVLTTLTPIWLTKPETARRVRQRIRAVLEWAIVAGHRKEANPAISVGAGLPRQGDRGRHFEAMLYADVPAFVRKLRAGASGEIVRLALEFAILSAARTGEVIGACWPEISFKETTWVVPAGRMKARREHRVPLSPRCMEILRRARDLRPKSELVFPGARGRPLSNMAMAMLMRRLGREETVHGFRSSFRDWAAEATDFPREVCEAALAHTLENRVERAYRRSDLFERRRALMASWGEFLK